MHFEAFLFDVDGTLADTERDGHRVAFNRAFADAGLDWDWDAALYGELLAVTGGKERIRHYLERFHPDFEADGPLDAFIAGLHRAKTAHYTRLLADPGIPLRPGVLRILETARASGIRLSIATTTTPDNVMALLEHSIAPDAADWFEVIAAGDIVPEKKPAPDIYRYALDQMGLTADCALAFEDSENGVRSARGAGLATIVTVNDYTRDQDFHGAVAVLDGFGEPQAPCRAIAGAAPAGGVVDLDFLQSLAR
ncbi:MAG: HAD family hydrolase [Chromatiales bacterium]|nr:HAD family hydrolase [Chromatiales bacterium]